MGLSVERRAELERKGARETNVQELFGLDDADMQVIELRIRIAREVKRRRLAAKMSQKTLADRAGCLPASNPVHRSWNVVEPGNRRAGVLRHGWDALGTRGGRPRTVDNLAQCLGPISP